MRRGFILLGLLLACLLESASAGDPVYKPVTRGSIAGYTGFIPGRQHEVGLNYRSASSRYYTELERQALIRDKSRTKGEAGGGKPGHQHRIGTTSGTSSTSHGVGTQRHHTDPKMIPIAGYGGFVPLARTSPIGVGKPFQQVVNEGFTKMHDLAS